MRWGRARLGWEARGERPWAHRRRQLRRELVARDGAVCWYCGTPFGPRLAGATLDHLVPRSRVPSWDAAALVLACGPCNQAKADTLPQELLRPAPGRFGPGLVELHAAVVGPVETVTAGECHCHHRPAVSGLAGAKSTRASYACEAAPGGHGGLRGVA